MRHNWERAESGLSLNLPATGTSMGGTGLSNHGVVLRNRYRFRELTGLNTDHLDLEKHQIKVLGKGSRERIVPR